MNEILDALLRALAFGTPLLLASLGAIVNERAGVVNLGVEGMMALGALAGFAVAYGGGMGGNLWLAVFAAMLVGALAALLHAFVTITMRANQFVSGLALTLLGLGAGRTAGQGVRGVSAVQPAAAVALYSRGHRAGAAAGGRVAVHPHRPDPQIGG
ncbi:ABC transporter permease subunit [Deinococcus sp.]|uniref:ABC transporter permease subunit n=1 Tax=Deinococcus sp. TaxID=47478 RepID=UPI00286DA6DC|nr:hypothetical protein [Deinococcus sp.]